MLCKIMLATVHKILLAQICKRRRVSTFLVFNATSNYARSACSLARCTEQWTYHLYQPTLVPI